MPRILIVLQPLLLFALVGPALGQQLYIYPSQGQSQEQLNQDRYQFHTWAVQQTGFDPTRPQTAYTAPPPQQEAPQGGLLRGAGRGAAIGAIGGAIGGDAGKGAAIGAAAGPTGGLLADPASVGAIAPDGAVARSLALGTFELESLDLDARAEIFGRSMDNPDAPLLMAAAADDKGAEKPMSAECSAFKLDIDADLGDVLRAGCQPTLAQMSALMNNPLGNVAMLYTQFDFTRLKNPSTGKTADKGNYMGIAQFPKRLNKDWNLINRVIWNVPSIPLDQDKLDAAKIGVSNASDSFIVPPGSPPLIDLFGGRTTGFGDMYYVGLFSPTEPIKLDGGGKFVWGAGFDLGFPTASEDILGTGRWTAGPSALGVYLGRKWKIGALATQFWDFAGEDDRDDVNLTNLQYFVFYSLDETTSIGAAPNIIANWQQTDDNILTLPVGIGISKTFKFGKVPVRFGAEIHYSVIQPDDVAGADWNFRFYVIPAVPSALFSWMQ